MKMKFKSSHILIVLCIILTVVIVFQQIYFNHEIHNLKIPQNINIISRSYQKEITDFINTNIEKIVSDEHMNSGKWIPTKIEFLKKDLVLVYYEDGHDIGHVILKIDKVDNSIEYDIFE